MARGSGLLYVSVAAVLALALVGLLAAPASWPELATAALHLARVPRALGLDVPAGEGEQPERQPLLAKLRRRLQTALPAAAGAAGPSAPGAAVAAAAAAAAQPAATEEPKKKKENKNAMCIVGNIRTLPLTFDSLERFAVSNGMDVFFMLNRGHVHGSTWLQYSALFFGQEVETKLIEELQRRTQNPTPPGKMTVRRVAVADRGDCEEYNRVFRPHEKTFSTLCRETGTHAQLRYVRTCFSMLLASTTKYDIVVRTRPDVGIFEPLMVNQFQPNPEMYGLWATWKLGSPRVGGDWFYFLQGRTLFEYWARVEQEASRNMGNWPFLDFTQFTIANVRCYHFPIVIVRSDHMAECCRFTEGGGGFQQGLWQGSPPGPLMEGKCGTALNNGIFTKVVDFLNYTGPVPFHPAGKRTCNIDHR